jgi:ATP-dependent Lhr-like helicase
MKGRGGAPLGEVEEAFAASLSPGDTFLIGGEIVRYESLREMTVEVSRDRGQKPKIAVFMGIKFATSTQLVGPHPGDVPAGRLAPLPRHTADWLALQRALSACPNAGRLLSRAFPRDGRTPASTGLPGATRSRRWACC